MKEIPQNLEAEDFEATCNTRGFMHQLNEISQAFIDFAPHAPGSIVDIGAAYGVAILPILKQKIEVIVNDMEESHLDELARRIEPNLLAYFKPKPGYFPTKINFKEKSIGAILFSHVLHFLNPDEMDISFEKLAKWLVPGGKVFIIVYSPYNGTMRGFIPIYEQRRAKGIKWPYWVNNNVRDYFKGSEVVANNLPPTMNYFDVPILVEALTQQGFKIERAEYLDREKNNIPAETWLDGREWTGIIARKI